MPCLQSVGISSCLPVCCTPVSFSVGLCSFSQKHLVLGISHIYVVAFSSQAVTNHFSILFSRKLSTGLSSFLMWSNLVFPLAHLNILISAEFSLLSSFFFTAQHSEPYVIAGHRWSNDCLEVRLCLSIPQASSYRTSPRIIPSTSSTPFLSYIHIIVDISL